MAGKPPASPSMPHGGDRHPDEPFNHVDLFRTPNDKSHWPVQDDLGSVALGGAARDK